MLEILRAHVFVADRNVGRNQRLQPLDRDVVFNVLLELRHRHVEPLVDELRVLALADELAVREDHLPGRPGLQVVQNVGVSSRDAQAVRFLQQHLLLDHLLANLALKELHDHWIVGIRRVALHDLAARHFLNLLQADRVARGENLAVPVRIDHRISIGGRRCRAHQAGDEVNHH